MFAHIIVVPKLLPVAYSLSSRYRAKDSFFKETTTNKETKGNKKRKKKWKRFYRLHLL